MTNIETSLNGPSNGVSKNIVVPAPPVASSTPTENGSQVQPTAKESTNTVRSTSKVAFNSLGWQIRNERGYEIPDERYGTSQRLRIIHIGAGASGIIFSKFAEEELENYELQIYEKNSAVGGTWLENRYPGCACDIPSVCYQFTWDRNPNWSHYYSASPEICRYFQDIAAKHKLTKYMKFNHSVVAARWEAGEGQWRVTVRDGDGHEFTDVCHILVNGSGILNNWKWPDIEGLHSFKGELMHSARYKEGFDLTDKRVAVIGIGSSGVQIIANIASKVRELHTWVRTPTWITAGFAQRFAGPNGANFEYTDEQKRKFKEDPDLFLRYSKMIESELNQRFKFILNNTPEAAAAKAFAEKEMAGKLSGKQELIDAIVPKNFNVGCRRPTPGNGFLEALTQDNVHTHLKILQRVTPNGFIDDDGKEIEVDVIICATGFNTSWIPRFSVDANGLSLQEMWKDEPYSYLSIAAPGIPNYYMMGGPYGPLGHGSFLPILEVISRHILQVAKKMQVEKIKSLAPKASVTSQFKEHADLFLKRTAWSSGCSSWFKQNRLDGPLPMFPGSRLLYLSLLANPRYEDYDIEYSNSLNMFEFLGDGFDTREFDGRDLSYYLGLLDGKDVQLDLEAELSEEMSSLVPRE